MICFAVNDAEFNELFNKFFKLRFGYTVYGYRKNCRQGVNIVVITVFNKFAILNVCGVNGE